MPAPGAAESGGSRSIACARRLGRGRTDRRRGPAPAAPDGRSSRRAGADLDRCERLARRAPMDAQRARRRPGRARPRSAGRAASLRWDAVQVDLRGERAQITLRAEVEPFAVAPLLARAAADNGLARRPDSWRARIDVRAAERIDADIVVERADGDLHMSSGGATQLLGLTELRLALSAHDGIWNFTPVLRGRSLGDVVGQVRVRPAGRAALARRRRAAGRQLQARVRRHRHLERLGAAGLAAGRRAATQRDASAAASARRSTPARSAAAGWACATCCKACNVSDGQRRCPAGGRQRADRALHAASGGDGTLHRHRRRHARRSTPQARLQLKAEQFRVLGRVDRSVVASGSAELQFDAARTGQRRRQASRSTRG